MITLKLTHGLSHDNGYVRATEKDPFVTVEDEAVAQFCVDSGFFEIVKDSKAPEKSNEPAKGNEIQTPDTLTPSGNEAEATPASPNNEDDELAAMTVAELRSYAETTGVDLGKLVKKADIIAAIRKAEAE